MSILVVGTVALDAVQTPFGRVQDVLGGSAVYAAVSASFFNRVKLLSIAGEDFPKKFIRFLGSRKIDTQGLSITKGKTFKWSGRYTYDLNSAQTLKTELKLLAKFNPQLNTAYRNARFVFLANIDPQVQLKVLAQLNRPQLVVADTMNYWIEHKKKILTKVIKKCDILSLNDAEAREYCGQANLIKAARSLLALGPRLIIIKRGEYGSLLFARSFCFSVPAYLLENVLDPTGAGDTFAGGFLGFLSCCARIRPAQLKKAVALGSVMASYVVEDFSLNRLQKLQPKDIRARFKQFQRLTRF